MAAKSIIVIFLLGFTTMRSNDLHQQLVKEYSASYCSILEEHYGNGMLSEGGPEGVERMFKGIDLTDKKVLDVGSGLGGVARYLVENHNVDITGLEINPWMIQEATKRIPECAKSRLRYVLSAADNKLNFPDNHFDIIYSKEVFVHVEDKQPLFKELKRVLKPGGVLVIADWVAAEDGIWSESLQEMMEADGLTLFAESTKTYVVDLQKAGFTMKELYDESPFYIRWLSGVYATMTGSKKEKLIKMLGEEQYQVEIEGYRIIAEAFKNQELYLMVFVAK